MQVVGTYSKLVTRDLKAMSLAPLRITVTKDDSILDIQEMRKEVGVVKID